MVVTKSTDPDQLDFERLIPFETYGNGEKTLIFLHANGYPPGAYAPLFHALGAGYRVLAMQLRPLWQESRPEHLRNWKIFSTDLITFARQQNLQNIPAVGHSMGGTLLLRAALWQPQIFSKIILIDPVILPPQYIVLWKMLSFIPFSTNLHPLVKAAQKRRTSFSSEEDMFANYRKKKIFENISDEGLRAYVHAMALPSRDGQVHLRYSPEWEARIYTTGIKDDLDLWRNMRRITQPLMVLRGERSNTFWAQTAMRMKKLRSETRICVVEETTHLLPLEKPHQVSRLMLDFLEDRT